MFAAYMKRRTSHHPTKSAHVSDSLQARVTAALGQPSACIYEEGGRDFQLVPRKAASNGQCTVIDLSRISPSCFRPGFFDVSGVPPC